MELRAFNGEREPTGTTLRANAAFQIRYGPLSSCLQVATLCCIFAALGWGVYIVGFALRINDK